MFIENSLFKMEVIQNYDIALKKGGMVIFDEFGFHRGSSPARTSRMVLRYLLDQDIHVFKSIIFFKVY